MRIPSLLFLVLLTSGLLLPAVLALVSRRHLAGKANGVDCPTDVKNCIEPITSKICSGNGACVCGQCACFQTDFESFYGRFCQHCESCMPNHCETLRPCIECRIHSTGRYKTRQDCEANCSRFPQILIDQVTSSGEKDGHYFCSFRDTENCEFYFMYGYDATGNLVIIAERDKECPLVDILVPAPHKLSKDPQQRPVPYTSTVPAKPRPPTLFHPPNATHPLGGALNSQAFDLMVVCGLRLTRRASTRTTQLPENFHRNGIHFDVENCQFVPRSKSFNLVEAVRPLTLEVEESVMSSGTCWNSWTHFWIFPPLVLYMNRRY